MNPIYDVAVIGAGVAGLTCASLLQRDGYRVVLLEAHDKPGGCAGFFRAGEWQFSAGATVALGLEIGGLHRRIFDYLGVQTPKVEPLERLRVVLPKREVSIWHDPQKWRSERRQLPGNKIGQEIFWRLQETVADASWRALHRLPSLPIQTSRDLVRMVRTAHPSLAPIAPFLFSTVEEICRILRIQNDREFQSLIELGLIITTQSRAQKAPFVNGAAGLDLWRHGAFYVPGGIGEIARLLLDNFQKNGGEFEKETRVQNVAKAGEVFRLQTSKGEFRAARVVANLPIWNLEKIVEFSPRAQKNVEKAAKRAGDGWGAAMLYCALREGALDPKMPLHHQVLLDTNAHPGDGSDAFLSLSMPGDLAQAPEGFRALTVSTHTHLSDWRELSRGDYRAQKRQWRAKLLKCVQRALPHFEEAIKFTIYGTPSTWEKYTARPGGSVGGAPLTLENANLRALPMRFGLKNFWMTGDTAFPGQGTVACALSGLNVWRDITGKTNF